MRRVFQVSGLSGLLLTGLWSAQSFAQESANPQPSNEGPKVEQAAPVAPVAEVETPAPVVVPVVAKPKVGDIRTSGYFRGGFGANIDQKGRATCFGLASINGSLKSKYRLGNECEQWAEYQLSTVVHVGDDGTVGTFHFMPVAFIPTTFIGYSPAMTTSAQDQQKQTSSGATVAFPNIYADLKGISWLLGGTAWVGSRYYKREAVYISDFFYWNPSGVGAGFEDINVGQLLAPDSSMLKDLSFSYAAFAVDGQPVGNPYLPQRYALGIRNDLQLRGLKLWGGADLQFGFQYIANWSSSKNDVGDNAPTSGGWGATVRYVQDILGGQNKLVFQYGKGGGTGFGTLARFYYPDFSLNQDISETRWRVVDVLAIQPTEELGVHAAFVFQRDNNKTPSAGDWISAGARVSYALTNNFKVLSEVGHDSVIPTNKSGRRALTKYTIALALGTAKGLMARPELRLFFTRGMWNETARTAHIDSGDLYLGTNYLSANIAGLQAEAMW